MLNVKKNSRIGFRPHRGLFFYLYYEAEFLGIDEDFGFRPHRGLFFYL